MRKCNVIDNVLFVVWNVWSKADISPLHGRHYNHLDFEETRRSSEWARVLFHSICSSIIEESDCCLDPLSWICPGSIHCSFSCCCEAQSTLSANSGQRITSAWMLPRENECQWLEWWLGEIDFRWTKAWTKAKNERIISSFRSTFIFCNFCLVLLSPEGLIVLVGNYYTIMMFSKKKIYFCSLLIYWRLLFCHS